MIPELERIAVTAGREIMRIVADRGLVFETKVDGSRRSNADLSSEKLIVSELRRLFPDIPVIAEESTDDGVVQEVVGERFFLVDPLDGTRELEAGNGQFAVNIALVESGRPTVGVMYAPAENRLYSVRQGVAVTAVVAPDGAIGPTDVITCRPARSASRGIVSRSRSAEALDHLAGMGIVDVVRIGSTLKFCKVAEGYADVYVSRGATREWDTAAGEAILTAAGGEVVSLDTGEPLVYGKASGVKPFLNGDFIARARDSV